MASHLMAALEEQIAETELEVEYSYFIQLSQEQLNAITEKYGNAKKKVFSESKLSYNENLGIAGRIRHYHQPEGSKFELTSKQRGNEAKAKLESNIELDQMNYNMLLASAKSTVVRTRLYIPVLKTDGNTIPRKDGTPLMWELDLYIDGRNLTEGATPIHPWAKLEMEVDKATLESVTEYIPFEYEELIPADTQEVTERALIDSLYSSDYDVRGKFREESLSSIVDYS